jgi:hypothetical protein
MNSVLREIQQHAAVLPLALQAELLNYTIYLENKAQDALEWNNLMLAQANSLTDWDNAEDEVWNDVSAI